MKNADTASPSIPSSSVSSPSTPSRLNPIVPVSIPPSKDIPPARRQSTDISLDEIENIKFVPPKRQRHGLKWAAGFLLVAGIGSAGYWQRAWLMPQFARMLGGVKSAIAQVDLDVLSRDRATEPATADIEPSNSGSAPDSTPDGSLDAPSVSPELAEGNQNPVAVESDQLLNHRRYEVADEDTLVPVTAGSEIRLKPKAQADITRLLAKANAEGIQLGLISGFRTLADQDYLYFDLKAERGESAQTRAAVSAPPGYSEHHTGYAVDFIDESQPKTHLEESFETTAAFAWLEKNAAFFNFEMSFPKDNDAQVSYEPWHWRYVGNQESLELFYK